MTSESLRRRLINPDSLRPLYTPAEIIQSTAQILTTRQQGLRLLGFEESIVEAAGELMGVSPVNLVILPEGSSCINPEDLFRQGDEAGLVTCAEFSIREDGEWQAHFKRGEEEIIIVPVNRIKVTDPVIVED